MYGWFTSLVSIKRLVKQCQIIVFFRFLRLPDLVSSLIPPDREEWLEFLLMLEVGVDELVQE